jgi:hypothetical protein
MNTIKESVEQTIKKFVKVLAIAAVCVTGLKSEAQFTYPSGNVTLSQFVLAGTMTNLVQRSFKVTSITIVSTNASTGLLVDAFTNSTVYVTQPYTNIVYALTNAAALATNGVYSQFFYTNYYGVVQQVTNVAGYPQQFVMVELTNSVPTTTNNLPSTVIGTGGSTPVFINNLSQAFIRGIWVTNTSATSSFTVSVSGNYFGN